MIEVKRELYQQCLDLVQDRISLAENGLKAAQVAANNETKSSAGDKYETGRAMMHLEKEKLSLQLSEAIKMRKALNLINPLKVTMKVELGSIVKMSTTNYFISISAGVLKVGEETYFAISPVSPIGQQLINKSSGDEFTFGGKTQQLAAIF